MQRAVFSDALVDSPIRAGIKTSRDRCAGCSAFGSFRWDGNDRHGRTFRGRGWVLTGLTLAPGSIEFYQGANLIMTINYRSARLTEFGFGARNRATDPDNVEIVYSGFPPSFELTEESFAFSFANYATPAQGWVTTTASFTSSAIPEPATLVVLGIGFVAMLRRRR